MASINGVSLKNIRNTQGREGEGFTASLYMDKKKIGTVAEYADGGAMRFYIEGAQNQILFSYRVDAYATEETETEFKRAKLICDLLDLTDLAKQYKKFMSGMSNKEFTMFVLYKIDPVLKYNKFIGIYICTTLDAIKEHGIEYDEVKTFISMNDFNVLTGEYKEKPELIKV